MKSIAFLTWVIAAAPALQQPKIALTFSAERAEHQSLADDARQIWAANGARMLAALEAVSGLRFEEKTIAVVLREGPSVSGAPVPTSAMRLNVRYPIPMSLIHELGHRLNAAHGLHSQPNGPRMHWATGNLAEDAHRVLYLYLYDVWVRLYGQETADSWVETEKGWAALGFDFTKAAWEWALSLGEQGRATTLREVIAGSKRKPG